MRSRRLSGTSRRVLKESSPTRAPLSVVQKVLQVVYVSVCCLSDENPKKLAKFYQKFANFLGEIWIPGNSLQNPEIPANFCKNRGEKSPISSKIEQNLEIIHQKNSQIRKNLQNFSVERCEGVQDLVDLQKC